jgi:hypothetical protein
LSLKCSVQQVLELEQRMSQGNAELEASNMRMRRDLEAKSYPAGYETTVISI